MQERHQKEIPSNIEMINKNIFGWKKFDLIILASHLGMSKTELAIQKTCFAAGLGFPGSFLFPRYE
ncbi:MAG: hypothetical protein ACMUEM_02110 [Flavobacteriales bacterium AspAUS03]